MNPKLFSETYLRSYTGTLNSEHEISLYQEMQAMDPKPCLMPDRNLWELAQCHAIEAGERGHVGHDRVNCEEDFRGECCQYGPSDPLKIVCQLLVDAGVPSLGHRRICLGNYTLLGVSIQPHSVYGSNAVLDFR